MRTALKKYDKKKILAWITIILSVLLRLTSINMPLIEEYAGGRQTFTALPVQVWVQNGGVDMIHYEIPILGEPWRIPYEFPIYQASAYFVFQILSKLGIVNNIDCALRITSMIWFYLSVFFLYKMINLLFRDNYNKHIIVYNTILWYLFLPFSVLISRTALIDVCAAGLGLMYGYYLLLLLTKDPDDCKAGSFIFTIIIGILAYLSKATSMFPIAFFTAFAGIKCLYDEKRLKLQWIKQKGHILYYLKLLLTVLLPVVPTVLWIRYADLVKDNAGLYTITSKGLKNFNYGTWEQKTNVENYGVILNRLNAVVPIAFLLLVLVLMIYIKSTTEKVEFIIISALFAVIGTIFVIFNLYYCHTYYFIAVLPFLCIFLGLSTSKVIINYIRKPYVGLKISITVFCLLITLYLSLGKTVYELKGSEGIRHYMNIGRAVKSFTTEEDKFILFNWGWDSTIAYYAERKAICVTGSLSQGSVLGPYETQKEKFSNVNYVLFSGISDTVSETLQYADTRDLFLMERIYSGYSCNAYRKVNIGINCEEDLNNNLFSGTINSCQETGDGNYIITGHINGISGNGIAAYYESGDGDIVPIITGLYERDDMPYESESETEGDGFAFKVNKSYWDCAKGHEIVVMCHKDSKWYKSRVCLE